MASEDYATEGQIKRLYAVLHSVGLDPKQWKKDQNIASYAKLTRAQCSVYIDEVEALEAEQKSTGSYNPQLPRKPDETELFGARAHAEAQRISEEQGRAAAQSKDIEYTDMRTQVTEAELIKKFTNLLAQVTEAVKAEDCISDREKGYATNWVADAVKDAMQKGGDREEQV